MDEIVLRAMAKWPNVPAVYGWLGLDRRGNWLLKGERISNEGVNAFIGRNYAADAQGRWYFQNGPQRVFVELEYTPLILRVAGGDPGAPLFVAHTGGMVSRVDGAWLDDTGALVLLTDLGPGVVDDRDLDRLTPDFVDVNGNAVSEDVLEELIDLAAELKSVPLWLRIGERSVKIESIAASALPGRLSFVRVPEPPAGDEPLARP